MNLTISKRVSAHTKTLTAMWCKKDFLPYDEKFRRVRGHSRNPMNKCFWCKRGFEDGEQMALACFTSGAKGNKVLCGKCADKLIASGEHQ